MLNEKKLLTNMMTVEDITPVSISDFITAHTNFTISSLSVKKYGRLLAVNFLVKYSSTWNAGSTGNIGTIKSGFRPAVTAGGASASFRELVATNGEVYLRAADTIAANSNEAVAIMYILA